jgi:hypothetical protein
MAKGLGLEAKSAIFARFFIFCRQQHRGGRPFVEVETRRTSVVLPEPIWSTAALAAVRGSYMRQVEWMPTDLRRIA